MDLLDGLKRREGHREKPYKCTEGVWTWGYGFTSMSPDESDAVLRIKVAKIRSTLDPVIHKLSEARQDVLVEAAYQMGVDGLFKFRRMWEAIYRRDFNTAAAEMLDSKWAQQTNSRARLLADKMRQG